MFTDPTTLGVAALLTVSTGVTDSLIHAAYPPIGPRRSSPSDGRAAAWFWSFASVFNGCILQLGTLILLEPPEPTPAWAGDLVTTLILMMFLHQALFYATDRFLFRRGVARPFPEGEPHIHNLWTSPRLKLHLTDGGVLLVDAAAALVLVAMELLT